jgi:hypothetical protein
MKTRLGTRFEPRAQALSVLAGFLSASRWASEASADQMVWCRRDGLRRDGVVDLGARGAGA